MFKRRHQRNSLRAALLAPVLFALLSASPTISPAHAADGDFDADGLSDLSAAQVGPAVTAWYTNASSNGTAIYHVFDGVADALAHGRFFSGDPRSYPAAIFQKGSLLQWRIKNRFVGESSVTFGVAGDTVPNQSDVDCDGVTDFIVARNGSENNFPGFKLWYVATSSKPGYVQQLLFGLAGDQVATSDMDGDGCAELLLFRADYTWYSRKLFGENVAQFQWGVPGDIPLLPKDVNGDGLADYSVARVTGGTQTALLRLSSGGYEEIPLGFASSIPMIGNFMGVPFYAWVERAAGAAGIQSVSRVPFVFPFGNVTNHLIRPDGTVVPPSASPKSTSLQQIVGSPGVTPASGSGAYAAVSCTHSWTVIKRPYVFSPFAGKGTKLVLDPKYTGQFQSGSVFRVYDAVTGALLGSAGPFGDLEEGGRVRAYLEPNARNMPPRVNITATSRAGTTLCFVNISTASKQK